MKLIFLDIDGVFNHEQWYRRREEEGLELEGNEAYDFDPNCVSIFNDIIEQTGAKIVVSSTWRRGDLQFLKDLFSLVGIKGEVVGETKKLNWTCSPIGVSMPRGVEIQEYLKRVHKYPEYTWDLNGVKTDISAYIIIDDDSDMLYEQRDNFVHTQNLFGLTVDDAVKAVYILNTPERTKAIQDKRDNIHNMLIKEAKQ